MNRSGASAFGGFPRNRLLNAQSILYAAGPFR
jgi:hypothetical protein